MAHSTLLPLPVFATVVAHAPLVAIDLVVLRGSGAQQQVLLGKRCNRPAQGSWFVPGGRIFKDEPLQAAMQRTVQTELGLSLAGLAALAGQAVLPQWLGVYEHFYADSFPDPATSTHYVVLAHTLRLPPALASDALAGLPVQGAGAAVQPGQHTAWQWWPTAQALASADVHAHTKAYLVNMQ